MVTGGQDAVELELELMASWDRDAAEAELLGDLVAGSIRSPE